MHTIFRMYTKVYHTGKSREKILKTGTLQTCQIWRENRFLLFLIRKPRKNRPKNLVTIFSWKNGFDTWWKDTQTHHLCSLVTLMHIALFQNLPIVTFILTNHTLQVSISNEAKTFYWLLWGIHVFSRPTNNMHYWSICGNTTCLKVKQPNDNVLS